MVAKLRSLFGSEFGLAVLERKDAAYMKVNVQSAAKGQCQ